MKEREKEGKEREGRKEGRKREKKVNLRTSLGPTSLGSVCTYLEF